MIERRRTWKALKTHDISYKKVFEQESWKKWKVRRVKIQGEEKEEFLFGFN